MTPRSASREFRPAAGHTDETRGRLRILVMSRTRPTDGSDDVIAQLAPMRRYARALTRDETQAEDLVHDALVRAYERRSTFRSGANLRNWLLSILHNAFIDTRRRRDAELRREAEAAQLAETSFPAEQEGSVYLQQIGRTFFALPDEQRTVIHLVAIEGLAYQEAANALPGRSLVPDDEVLQLAKDRLPRGQHLAHVAPVHAYQHDGAVDTDGRDVGRGLLEEVDELLPRLLAGGDQELAMLSAAPPLKARDLQIVGRVGEGHPGLGAGHEGLNIGVGSGVAAHQAMLTHKPQITRARHRLRLKLRGSVIGSGEVRAEIVQDRVDLGRVEAGRGELEALPLEQLRKLGELLCQRLSVPAGVLGQLVVGNREQALLGVGEPDRLDRRHDLQPK